MPTIQFFQYMQTVELRAGLTVSSLFPSTPSPGQALVMLAINETLREINNHYYMAFQQTETIITPPPGTLALNLTQAPYNLVFWDVTRMARNGVRRQKDDYPLEFIDYTELDFLQPSLVGNSLSTHYSQFGQELLLYPGADGSNLLIRYYPLCIGVDVTGETYKLTLNATDDVPFLQDQYQDALIYGAVTKIRLQQKIDEKYNETKKQWEQWRTFLNDMQHPGEDGFSQIMIPTNSEDRLTRKIGPFFNANIS